VHWSLGFRFLGTGEFAKVITAGNGFIVPLSDRMFSAPDDHVIVRFYLAVKLKMGLGVNVVSGEMGLENGLFWWWLFVLDTLSNGTILDRWFVQPFAPGAAGKSRSDILSLLDSQTHTPG
jgi:hypothetical protein